MLKSYEELRKVDVKPFCEERDGALYLNWAKCVDLLHEYGAKKVYWLPIPDEKTGTSLRMADVTFKDSKGNENRCYETRIRVFIDDQVYDMQSPVMNGSNPVKDNSMSQQRVWNSMCRSFVKCVAIHTGLGFDLWLKEEMKPFSNVVPEESKKASDAHIKTLKNLGKKLGLNMDAWVEQNGKTWKTLTEKDAGFMLNALRQKYGDLVDDYGGADGN